MSKNPDTQSSSEALRRAIQKNQRNREKEREALLTAMKEAVIHVYDAPEEPEELDTDWRIR